MDFNEYNKYKWFFTSSGKLVIGGKSAEQNDSLLKELKNKGKNLLVMHTASPGSPFSAILSDIKNITKADKEEAAVFTACFSQAWKSKAEKTEVHSFFLNNISKLKIRKAGTWQVSKIEEKFSVALELVLIKQNDILRAVPKKTAKGKKILFRIFPGNVEKKDLLVKAGIISNEDFSQAQILQALPAGGIRIEK